MWQPGTRVLTITLLLWLVFVGGHACGRCSTSARPEPVTILHVNRGCLVRARPPEVKLDWLGPGEAGCPTTVTACLSQENLLTLLVYLDDLQTYAKQAEALCGPPSPTEPTP